MSASGEKHDLFSHLAGGRVEAAAMSKRHSQARLNYIARELNERPRMTLGYQSPAERFQARVALTG
jgi:transposase InsO family protein